MRSSSEMSGKMWTFAVGSLLRAFFLALIYPKGYKGDSPAGEGFKFGFYIGLNQFVLGFAFNYNSFIKS